MESNIEEANNVSKDTPLPQANLMQKSMVLNYHNYQVSLNPKHKQSDTIRHFAAQKIFSISRSSLNRWIAKEDKIKEDALKLSSRSRSMTKVRRTQKPSLLHIAEFFKVNQHIISCLEMYYVQNLLLDPLDFPLDKEIASKFNEFKNLFGESDSVVNGILIENESWPQSFKNEIHYQISAIQDNLNEQENIQKNSKVLIMEKNRLQKIFANYDPNNIYQFSEIILDIYTLFKITELNGIDELYSNSGSMETEFQNCELRVEPTVTIGVAGNVTGTDFPPPLIVTNLLGNGVGNANTSSTSPANGNSSNRFINEFSYDPEGLNRRDIFRDYLYKWDTRLVAENREIVLLLDTYWCHFGLGEHRLQHFQKIKLIFINSKYDQTSSYYQRSHLRLPFSVGFERLIKYQLKIGLFNKFYKDSRVLHSREEVFNDCIGIINNIKVNYDNFIYKLQKDDCLKTFYKLGFEGSRIFEPLYTIGDNVDVELQELQNQHERQDCPNDERSKNLYGRLTTFVRPLIPEEYKNKLQFSDTTRKLVVKQYEQELYQFVRQIVKAIVKLNPKQDFDASSLQSGILNEFTNGKFERKYNKKYSQTAIRDFVQTKIKFEKLRQKFKSRKEKEKQASINEDCFKKDLAVDKMLLNEIQPYLIKSFLSQNNSENEPKISNETYGLFNKFYTSYVNDTAIVSTKYKYWRKRNNPINGSSGILEAELNEINSRKKLKSNKYIADSDRSEDDIDPEIALQMTHQNGRPLIERHSPQPSPPPPSTTTTTATATNTTNNDTTAQQDSIDTQVTLNDVELIRGAVPNRDDQLQDIKFPSSSIGHKLEENKFVTSFSSDSEEEATIVV